MENAIPHTSHSFTSLLSRLGAMVPHYNHALAAPHPVLASDNPKPSSTKLPLDSEPAPTSLNVGKEK